MHEMQRSDRDRFITFHKEAMENPDSEKAFTIYDQAGMQWSQYDISSVMHYDGTVRFK